MVSCYFVGYNERSQGFKFYYLKVRIFFKMGNAKFLKDIELGIGDKSKDFVFQEKFIPLPLVTINHDQAFIPSLGQQENPATQDNIKNDLD